jgi:alkylhydroperoxidase/carboxymuconolactone decarboxylase family protein YurZ
MPEQTVKTPVLDLLASMTADSIEASSLDAETLMLVRIAALVAVDAPPVSYAFNLEAAGDLDIAAEQVRGVLTAVAPIVGTARIASATTKIVRALELELEVGGRQPFGRGLRTMASTRRRASLPPIPSIRGSTDE